jgi:hypothetical protein
LTRAARSTWRSVGSFFSFLFIVLQQELSNVADVDDKVGKRTDDSQHLRAVDQRLATLLGKPTLLRKRE